MESDFPQTVWAEGSEDCKLNRLVWDIPCTANTVMPMNKAKKWCIIFFKIDYELDFRHLWLLGKYNRN